MKKYITTLILAMAAIFNVSALSPTAIRENARFLSDRMAYELNLTPEQYEDCYEINYDFIYGINDLMDDVVFGYQDAIDNYYSYLDWRNDDLRMVLTAGQFARFCALEYFYRPIYTSGRSWLFRIHQIYTNHTHYYFGLPACYHSYYGAHSRHHYASSYYHGRYHHDIAPHYDHFRGHAHYLDVHRHDFGHDRHDRPASHHRGERPHDYRHNDRHDSYRSHERGDRPQRHESGPQHGGGSHRQERGDRPQRHEQGPQNGGGSHRQERGDRPQRQEQGPQNGGGNHEAGQRQHERGGNVGQRQERGGNVGQRQERGGNVGQRQERGGNGGQRHEGGERGGSHSRRR